MKPKFFLAAGVVLTLAFVLVLGTAAAEPAFPCDPAYVDKALNNIRVSPTGVDDTANIQCAFDLANATGPGITIRLLPGTFHTAPILIVDFHGVFRGSGRDHTTIVNLPDLTVAPDHSLPPSLDNPWPSMFTFIDSDVDLSNMAIHIIGESPVSDWSWAGEGPFNQYVTVIAISGTESHFNVSHLSLEGEHSSTSIFGYNVFNGIYYEGYFTTAGVDREPLSGSYTVMNSSFTSVAFATPIANIKDAKVVSSHNTYNDVGWAMDVTDTVNSSVKIFNNRMDASWGGVWLWMFFASEDLNTDFLIRNNTISGPLGIVLEHTMDAESTCLVKVNNLKGVTGIPIFVGPGAEACVLKNNKE
jgi:hypothetical protein